LSSLKAEVLDEMAILGQQTNNALIAQDAKIQMLEEQTQRKEADWQGTFGIMRANIEALAEELVKTGQEIKQVKRDQDKRMQRSEAATQESLISLRVELRALDIHATRSGEEAKLVQSWIKQPEKAEAATQQTLNSLRGEVGVLNKAMIQVANQCKEAQSGQEAMFIRFEE
jgi:hypothetical protein